MRFISKEGGRYRTEETEDYHHYNLRLGQASVVTVLRCHRGETSKSRVCHSSFTPQDFPKG